MKCCTIVVGNNFPPSILISRRLEHEKGLLRRREIIEMYFAGKTITEISNETGVARSTLTTWIKEYERKPKSTKQVNMRDYNDLKQKCEQQEKMIQILWTSPCTVSAPLSERYEAVKSMLEKFGYSITLTCKALQVDKGS